MMKTDREGSLGNCKTHNSANDDITYLNYLALAHCITMGDKEWRRRGNSILAQLRDNADIRADGGWVKRKRDIIVVTNVKNKKKKKFKTYKEAAEYADINPASIWIALKDGRIVKGKWKFEVEREDA